MWSKTFSDNFKIYCSLLENINCILASFEKLILNWLIEIFSIDSSESRPPYNPNENMSKVSGLLWEKTVWSCINLMTYYIWTKFSKILFAKWEWKNLTQTKLLIVKYKLVIPVIKIRVITILSEILWTNCAKTRWYADCRQLKMC